MPMVKPEAKLEQLPPTADISPENGNAWAPALNVELVVMTVMHNKTISNAEIFFFLSNINPP